MMINNCGSFYIEEPFGDKREKGFLAKNSLEKNDPVAIINEEALKLSLLNHQDLKNISEIGYSLENTNTGSTAKIKVIWEG